MTAFSTYTALAAAAPDPAKHVNYTLGMVLGVADFNQEFAYLNNRDQWALRETVGYGTVSGLQITQQSTGTGPIITIAPGTAVSPSGQLIKICQAQCANLNAWLADPGNQQLLTAQVGSPPGSAVNLYVVLCYRDCPTDTVPIPGEPCRCADQTTAASRTTDDFCLELRLVAPNQHEEDAVRRFVAWLRGAPIAGPGDTPATLAEFEQAVRHLESFESPPLSSPADPDWDLNFGSPPSSLFVPAEQAVEYFRAAMLIWVTELRPLWREAFPVGGCSCGCGSTGTAAATPEDCVLLAGVSVPLAWNALNSQWVIGNGPVQIDESRRPWLLDLRMIQELLLWPAPSAAGAALPAAAPLYGVVAAGVVSVPATGGGGETQIPPGPMFGGLVASLPTSGPAGILNVTFANYRPPDGTFQYIVKATPIDPGGTAPLIVTFKDFLPGPSAAQNGFQLNVFAPNGTAVALAGRQFMIEVSQFPFAG
jgi:hypothetical protein